MEEYSNEGVRGANLLSVGGSWRQNVVSSNVSGKFIGILFFGLLCLFLGSCASLEMGVHDDNNGPQSQPLTRHAPATGSRGQQAPESPAMSTLEGPIEVSIEEALLLALENNRSLRVERLNPRIIRTFEDQERAIFDPVLTGVVSGSRERGQLESRTTRESTSSGIDVDLGVSQFFRTGTEVGIHLSTEGTWSDLYNDQYATRTGLSVTQALLRGAGLKVNLATLRQARLDTRTSHHELRAFTEALVAQVEETYWDYALAERQIDIFLESLKLAEQQLSETEEMIKIGKLAESELAAAQAEVALRREGLINTRSNLEKTRLDLLRSLNPPGRNLWQRSIIIRDRPAVPEVKLDDVESHVAVAMRMRPDLNQARLGVQRGDLEVVKTKNGLLPKMDFFITLGKTGYADSFGGSVSDIGGKSYDISAGLILEYPLRNRDAEARHRRALLSAEQAEEALENLAQLVQVDVRSAYIEVNRAREQITATAATRRLLQEKARVETEKFRVGKSTTLLVGQAQRDLVSSRISEILAIVNYLKALVELYRLEGSLLERRGIAVPGRDPVKLLLENK